jgi:hypothetical protein
MRVVLLGILFSFYLTSLGQGSITTTENVECNCRKVLAAAKLAEDKPADFPGGGAIAFQKLYNTIPLQKIVLKHLKLANRLAQLHAKR